MLLAVAAACLFSAACSPQFALTPQDEIRIAVDAQHPLQLLPLHVAVAKGLFAAERIRATLVEFPDGSQAAAAAATGACDVAASSLDDVLLARATSPSVPPLKAFVQIARSPLLALAAPVYNPFLRSGPANLTSKPVAVQAAGDETDRFARYALHEDGVEDAEMMTVPQNHGDGAATLYEKRKIPGAVLDSLTLLDFDARSVRYRTVADTRTFAGLLATYGVSNYPAACLSAAPVWLEQHRDQAQRVARAMVAGIAWVRSHPVPDLLPLIPASLRNRAQEAVVSNAIIEARPLYSTDGLFTEDGAAAAWKTIVNVRPELRKSRLPAGVYTNEIVAPPKAAQQARSK